MKIGFARLKSKAREIINRRRYTMPAILETYFTRILNGSLACHSNEYKVDLNPAGCWIESSSFRSFRLRKIKENLYNGFEGEKENRNEILFLPSIHGFHSIQKDMKNYKNVRASSDAFFETYFIGARDIDLSFFK